MTDSLFSADTIERFHQAVADAARTGDDRASEVCRRLTAAITDADAGRTDLASAAINDAMDQTSDVRLLYLGYQFHFRLGHYDEAEVLIRRRLDAATVDSADEARAWNNYGLLHFFRGDLPAAERDLRRAIDIDTRIGCQEGIARDLGSLSLIPESRREWAEAERLNRQSLEIAERIGYRPVIASRLCNLGEIAMAQGHRDEARLLLSRAEAEFRALGVEKHRKLCEEHLRKLDERGVRHASPPS